MLLPSLFQKIVTIYYFYTIILPQIPLIYISFYYPITTANLFKITQHPFFLI